MMVMMLVLFLIMVMMMVMMSVFLTFIIAAVTFVIVIERHLSEPLQLRFKGVLLFHSLQDLGSVNGGPVRRNDGRCRILLTQKRYTLIQLRLGDVCCPGKNNTAGVLDLVIIELAEVLHEDLALFRVHNCCKAVEHQFIVLDALDRADDIGQFSDAGRLDQDPFRSIGIEHLLKGFSEIADQAAADAPLAHLGDFDPRFTHESAVHTDFTELIFNQNKLLAFVSLSDQFLDQRRLSRAEKT